MTGAKTFATTRQGLRDLDRPARPARAAGTNVGPNERAASTLGGALLAGYGLSRMGLCGLALAALGGALVYRGTTGHCHAYAAAGVNTAR
jgi:uncharacterized membrane protein